MVCVCTRVRTLTHTRAQTLPLSGKTKSTLIFLSFLLFSLPPSLLSACRRSHKKLVTNQKSMNPSFLNFLPLPPFLNKNVINHEEVASQVYINKYRLPVEFRFHKAFETKHGLRQYFKLSSTVFPITDISE